VTKGQILQMINQMIVSYRALFYDEKHNCFLYKDENGDRWFDMCANEFIGKYSLMNFSNSGKVIVLQDKLRDSMLPIKYNNSIFSWLELGAPARLLQKFNFNLRYASEYRYSSFVEWGEDDVQVIHPLNTNDRHLQYSYFDDVQFNAFMNTSEEPINEYEKLIWKYINKSDISMTDISLYTADALISSVYHKDIYLYTPIIIFIMRKILGLN